MRRDQFIEIKSFKKTRKKKVEPVQKNFYWIAKKNTDLLFNHGSSHKRVLHPRNLVSLIGLHRVDYGVSTDSVFYVGAFGNLLKI